MLEALRKRQVLQSNGGRGSSCGASPPVGLQTSRVKETLTPRCSGGAQLRQPNRSCDNSPGVEALADGCVSPGERLVRKDDNDVCSAITGPLPNIRERLLSGSFCVGLHRDCTNHVIRLAWLALQDLHRICRHGRIRWRWWRGRFAGCAAGGGQNDSARQ